MHVPLLALVCALAAGERPTLTRAFAIGVVGDHDRDGVPDYAVAGGRDPVLVRVFSGRDDRWLVEFATPVRPNCPFVLHEPHVAVLGDLDHDGASELIAADDRAWLLDGRTGAVIAELDDGSRFVGSIGDLDGDGRVDPFVSGPRELDGHGLGRVDTATPRSGRDLRPLLGWSARSARERAAYRAALDPARSFLDVAGLCDGLLVELRLEARVIGDSVVDVPRIVVCDGSDDPRFERAFEFELADTEWGGCGEFRVATTGDLDQDGLGDLIVALPAHAISPLERGSFLGALSSGDGRELWRCRELERESLNPSVDVLADRDGDGVDEVLVSLAGGVDPACVAVLSGRTGRVLATIAP